MRGNTHGTLNIAAGVNGLSNYNSAKFRVYEDGTLYASDANVSGTVNADSGHVGGFDIANNQLVADLDEIDTLQGMPSIKLSITEDDGNKSIELGSYRTTDEMDSPIIATKFEMQHSWMDNNSVEYEDDTVLTPENGIEIKHTTNDPMEEDYTVKINAYGITFNKSGTVQNIDWATLFRKLNSIT